VAEAGTTKLANRVFVLNCIAIGGAVVAGISILAEWPLVQLAAAVMLVPVLPAMLALSRASDGGVRFGVGKGTGRPDSPSGAGGMTASFAGLVFLLLDNHTSLGPDLWERRAAVALVCGALWLALDWTRLSAARKGFSLLGEGASLFALAGLWAVASLYLVNLHADTSVPECVQAPVLAKHEKTGRRQIDRYHLTVGPWRGWPLGAELSVTHINYNRAVVGTTVEVCVRRGALGEPWVDEVRVSKAQ